jgi:hypothetical protein
VIVFSKIVRENPKKLTYGIEHQFASPTSLGLDIPTTINFWYFTPAPPRGGSGISPSILEEMCRVREGSQPWKGFS